ncbi:SDR family oxidoreductase [Arenibaculum sp.]|uniref:SDR family NAD(P)-dependent oxidoreductase n=1 Tax=Arenibaculum sp. TaxID=2865862 RepID=UPI002E11B431|nr:SDR family oxidoreductase [Arenibaculum sp.]
MEELAGKVAIVTGAGRGIGLETAVALAGAGMRVVAAVRSADRAGDLADRLAAAGADHVVAACDVADHAQVDAMVADARGRFGRIDVLVNNAGVVEPIGMIADTDPGQWRHSLMVNLAGPYHLVRAAIGDLAATGDGVVVNVSSGAAHAPKEGWSAYCAGKAGLAMLTRSIDLEYRDAGVRAYGFMPGVVDTGMQAVIRASGINDVSRLPRSSLAPAAEPARVILHLCGTAARDLAGQELSIRDPELRRRAGLAT